MRRKYSFFETVRLLAAVADSQTRHFQYEKAERKRLATKTRTGRVSKPPKHMIKDYRRIHRSVPGLVGRLSHQLVLLRVARDALQLRVCCHVL